MTIQAPDYVRYNNKKYTLIDIEKGKNMIGEISELTSLDECIVSTACWRGYTADYFIEDGRLYAVRSERTWEDPEIIKVSSEKTRLHYTGSCIIAYDSEDDFMISDFLCCYLNYEEALELHFTNGVLDEVRDLSYAVREFHDGWENGGIERDSKGIITGKGIETREHLTCRDLKYQYDENTYRWQRR